MSMSIQKLTLVKIHHNNLKAFKNLEQSYEAEFSNLTLKMPDENGLFKTEHEILPNDQYIGYLLYYNQKTPIGFCLVNISDEVKDIAEFYIVPAMRKKKFGSKLAFMIFNKHPGPWQVRQINGANHAINFWRNVIKSYTRNKYNESIVQDDHWGCVTKQQFLA